MAKHDQQQNSGGASLDANRLIQRFKAEISEATGRAVIAEEQAAAERQRADVAEQLVESLQQRLEELEGDDSDAENTKPAPRRK